MTTETKSFRILSLTEDQFDVLYDLLEDTVDNISDNIDHEETKLSDYAIYEVWQQLNNPTPN